MCVIIHKPKGVDLPEAHIRKAATANSHGYGILWYDQKDRIVKAHKQAEYKIEDVIKQVAELKDTEVLLHFRIKTHGSVNDDNCHPFKVLDKGDTGMEMWLMHNGVIHKAKTEGDETDTMAFNREMLIPVLKHKPGILREEAFQKFAGEYIGHSKLAFMFGKGETVIVNKDKGTERGGCWYSNHSAFPTVVTTTTNHTAGWGDDDYDGYRWPAGGRGVRSPKKDPKEHLLIDTPIKEGAFVTVYAKKDLDFVERGVVKTVSDTFVLCEFDCKGTAKQQMFELKQGESLYPQKATMVDRLDERYYIIPEPVNEDSVEQAKKTVGQLLAEQNPKSNDDTKKKDQKETQITTPITSGAAEVCNILSIEDKRNERLKEEQEDNGTKKKESSTKQNETENAESFLPEFVTYEGDITCRVNSTMKLGPDAITIYEAYGPPEDNSPNVIDVYNMGAQERLDFFLGKTEQSFNMFQDLLDRFCLEELEYEKNEDDDDEDDDDEDPEDGDGGDESGAPEGANPTWEQHYNYGMSAQSASVMMH